MHPSDKACSYGAAFKSLIGTGAVELVEDSEEKIAALTGIMKHYTSRHWDFTAEQADAVAVFCLTVGRLSCKEHA